MTSNFRSYRYGQVLQGIEYNPRLFLYLLIAAITVIFAYQFATQMTSEWVKSAVGVAALMVVASVLTWPYQSVFVYIGLAACMPGFGRGETILGLGSALVYPADVFLGAFMVLEFFRGCMRQTHIYCSTDRWALVYLIWVVVCCVRGIAGYGYSAIGESRDCLNALGYFVAIHYITRSDQVESVMKWLKWICVIVGVVWFYRLVQSGFMPRATGGHVLLAVCMIAAALGVLLGRDHITRHRKLATLVLLFIVSFTILSLARNLIACLLLTIPFLLWIGRRYFFQSIILGALVTAIVVGFIGWLSSEVGSEVGSIFIKKWSALINPAADPTGSWRFYSYRWEMEKVFSNPFWVLIGQGFGGYYDWYFSLMDEPIRTAPHSALVQVWSKMGLLGLILHLCVLGSFFHRGFVFLRRSTNQLQRSIMMILLLAVFQIVVYQIGTGYTVYTWVILGIGTALPRLWSQPPAAPTVMGIITSSQREK